MIIDTKKIEKLLKTKITAYKIAQETGLSSTLCQTLKNGQKDILKLTLYNAIKLQELAEKIENNSGSI